MRGWRLGIAISIGIHAGLYLLAKSAPDEPAVAAREPEPVFLTMVDVPREPVRVEPEVEATPAEPAPPPKRSKAVTRKTRRRRRPTRRTAPSGGGGGGTATTDGTGAAVGPAGPGDGAGSVMAPADGDGIDLVLRPRAPGAADVEVLPSGPPPPAPDPRLKPSGGGTLTYEHQSFTGKIAHDGTVEFEDHIAGYTGLGFWFDVTDAAMRLADDDTYKSHKLKLLDETRGMRIEMAKAACEERLDKSLLSLRTDLDALWADRSISLDEKKRTIFTLWDDCAEDGSESIVEYGLMARATIIAFVQRKLGRGTAHAYTDEELVALNMRRHSKMRFDPYALP